MIRILYKDTEKTFNKYFDDVCKHHKKTTLKNLDDLKKHIKPSFTNYIQYIETIKKNYEDILKLKRDEFDYFRNNFLDLDSINFSTTNWIDTHNKGCYKGSFYSNIVNAMEYSSIRDKEYAEAIRTLGIKTCVYCNAEYTPIVKKSEIGRSHICHFEADHFYPKNKDPFLCISFYNLLPSCAFCNRSKSNNRSDFYLYTNNLADIEPFHFKLDDKSIIDYEHSLKADILKIIFEGDSTLKENYEKRFHISKIYESFKDEAEEIIWKAKTMKPSYIANLKASFQTIFMNLGENEIRFLYGFYSKTKDVYKRPLTKMKQDIAKQLKILK